MPNPSLSSFISSKQYNTEVVTVNPCITAFLAGSTYNAPSFTATSGTTNDPGGLFGWLIYARSNPSLSTTPPGTTADTYIEYSNPSDLVGDLNKLGGVTYCLVSKPGEGGTYGFFTNSSGEITALNPGIDFLHSINYLAYGGKLVIAGTTTGFENYENATGNYIDVLMGTTANATLAQWLQSNPYTVGVFPSVADSNGQVGAGYTMANFTSFTSSAAVATGSTFATRVFNVYGVKASYDVTTDLLVSGSKITAYYIPAVSDVAGFFTRAKNTNTLFVSVSGLSNSSILNGTIINGVNWENTSIKQILSKNRVNYFVNYTTKFLGQDLVGATANASTPTSVERIGPSELNIQIQKVVTDLALKYVFKSNVKTTRDSLVTEINSYLNSLATFIDTTQTQVVCDSSNNTDNSSTLTVAITVKPLVSSNSIVVNVSVGDTTA